MTQPEIQTIIDQVPSWQNAQEITVERQPGGWTNANYLLTVDGTRYVLRIGGANTAQLGIDRRTEREAILAAMQFERWLAECCAEAQTGLPKARRGRL